MYSVLSVVITLLKIYIHTLFAYTCKYKYLFSVQFFSSDKLYKLFPWKITTYKISIITLWTFGITSFPFLIFDDNQSFYLTQSIINLCQLDALKMEIRIRMWQSWAECVRSRTILSQEYFCIPNSVYIFTYVWWSLIVSWCRLSFNSVNFSNIVSMECF